jgi:catechol 2,3-dioxygenase-like lactoylglutathione lyase family enzyme
VPGKAKSSRKAALEFNHAIIYVRKLAPALHFYSELLGFQVIEQVGESYARFKSQSGQSTFALHVGEAGKPLGAEGIRLYFETKDLDKFCVALVAAGVVFKQLPKAMPWGWKHAYLNDPDGHEISLYWAGRKRYQKTPPMRG